MEIIKNHIHYFEKEIAQLAFPDTPKNLYDPIGYFFRARCKTNKTCFNFAFCGIIWLLKKKRH